MRVWIGIVCSLLLMMQCAVCIAQNISLQQETSSLKVSFDALKPGLSSLSVDSLKRGSFRANPIVDPDPSSVQYVTSEKNGWVRYALASDPAHIVWEMHCNGNTIAMRSLYQPNGGSKDITWRFDPDVTHATLLGHVTPAGDVTVPAVLHLPGMGSLRIYSTGTSHAALHYDAHRYPKGFVAVTFPAATAQQKVIEYTFETAAIYPVVPGMKADDPQYDGFRRDFIDIFQLQATYHVLANHAGSDACAMTLYKYSDIARYTPELVKGLTALDLVRESLDRYLDGFVSYAMPGFRMFDVKENWGENYPYPTLDTYPSLLIAAFNYVDGSGDQRWIKHNYPGIKKWTDKLMVENADGSPLLEYPFSGNSGSWTEKITVRPANWWDTVGFGHQDAYSNALAYRALKAMAALADRVGEKANAESYRKRAEKIRQVYVATFMDTSAGVLAGWRSTDGQLHNYYFPFINGIAVRYGLIDGEHAHMVMDNILKKMDSVGYKNFSLGLPGNLVPIKRADYPEPGLRYGGPTADNDGFQIYENGGATACHSYFTVAALYKLGETEKADKILMPMLDSFTNQGFSGRSSNGMTYDWKNWNGEANGYEGFLVDNYYTFLAVLDRAHMLVEMP